MNIEELFPQLVYFIPCAVFISAFISGTLGLAGGALLMLLLAHLLPVPIAFILHGVAQSSSNFVRASLYYKHTPWKNVSLFYGGLFLSGALLAFISWLPEKSTLFLLIGAVSVIALLVPKSLAPDFARPKFAFLAGVFVGVPTLIAGVSGGVLDSFFLKSDLNRFQVMASKSFGMLLMHLVKIAYAISFLTQPLESYAFLLPLLPSIVLSSLAGTLLGKSMLLRLNEAQFRVACCGVFAFITLLSLARGLHGL